MSGGDLAWAKIAWRALSQAGMTAHTSEAERTICVVRLITLSAMHREFCVRAFDEGDSGEWEEEITNELLGDYPLLDVFTLGQIAERRQIDVDNSPLYDSDPPVLLYVILELVKNEYQDVVDTLLKQWGRMDCSRHCTSLSSLVRMKTRPQRTKPLHPSPRIRLTTS